MDNFAKFIKDSFKIVNPNVKYEHNWHIEVIAEALEQVSKQKIKRLIINIAPRSLKSMIVSVAWPAWLLGCNPSNRIMSASYSQILSNKHSVDCRALINSDWYKKKFPKVKLVNDQNQKSKFMTKDRGFRFATSIGGTSTGEGGNFLIVDDPHNPMQAASNIQRQKAIDWFEQTFTTRLDDKKNGVIVIVMQRLHEEDLTGYLLKKSSDLWFNLKIPAIADEDESITIGKKLFTRKSGDLIHKEREGLEELNQMKIELGDYGFSAQYQQAPIPIIGSLIKRDWLKYYDSLPKINRFFQSWDTAIKATSTSDYSVCTIWGEADNGYYLIDVIRGRYEYPELKKLIISTYKQYISHAVLIEDKASGQSLIQDLAGDKLPIIAIKPIMDKVTRFARITTYFESGKIFFPNNTSWLSLYINEIFSFPNAAKDDQVDSTSQFLNWIITNKASLNIRRL